jgi:feruloyl esterase
VQATPHADEHPTPVQNAQDAQKKLPFCQGQNPSGPPPHGGLPPIFDTCAALASTVFPDGKITLAQTVSSGSFTAGPVTVTGLPAFCRVRGYATPTAQSNNINFEVWIPKGVAYNGKYEQIGSGGFAGFIDYPSLGEAIRRGYAAAATDDGNPVFQDPTFAKNAPEKIKDYGYRAIAQTHDKATSLISAYTGAAPKRSYFLGCSDGGREALIMAQRYPNDFDGIIAGAPANYFTHQFSGFAWNTQKSTAVPGFVPIVSPQAVGVLSTAVRSQCAGHDGGLPGDKFLTDPRDCIVDWSKISVCTMGQDPASGNSCLRSDQIAAIKAIYAGPAYSGTQVFPGFEPGAEDDPVGGWPVWITSGPFLGAFGLQAGFGVGFFQNFVYPNMFPAYNLTNFAMPADVTAADGLAGDLNATNPDLSQFRAHGGKLIQYAGWADPAVAPMNSINYYESVRSASGSTYTQMDSFYRLFMGPGLTHCAGGPGPNAFGQTAQTPGYPLDSDHDVLKALEKWVETNVAPDRIIATKYANNDASLGAAGVTDHRPMCHYPAMPRYNSATHQFDCIVPIKKIVPWPPIKVMHQ